MKKIFSIIIVAILFLTSSCGTILYPERRGQVSGRIDVGVAVLDGIGVLVFIIPGLIAFAVDFTTGAIYLPSGRFLSNLRAIRESGKTIVADSPLTQKNIEKILREQTGKNIDLDTEDLRVARLSADGRADLLPIDKILNGDQLRAFGQGRENAAPY